MWYLKKAAEKVKSISQNALKQETQIQELFKSIISNKNTIMPLKKMAQLSAKTYQNHYFEEIQKLLLQKLSDIKLEKKSLKKRLNLLVLTTYLVKHGASGFIDEFRENIDLIKKYQRLEQDYQDQTSQKLRNIMSQIKQRAVYLRTLLFDKKILLKQKQLARLIKQKMITFCGKQAYLETQKNQQEKKQKQERIQGFLEHYVWRYTNKIDRKLDELADIIVKKIDQYLDLQIPQNFSIQQLETTNISNQESKQNQTVVKQVKKEEQIFVDQKNCVEKNIVVDSDIFDAHLEMPQSQLKKENDDLIKFQENQSSKQCEKGSNTEEIKLEAQDQS